VLEYYVYNPVQLRCPIHGFHNAPGQVQTPVPVPQAPVAVAPVQAAVTRSQRAADTALVAEAVLAAEAAQALLDEDSDSNESLDSTVILESETDGDEDGDNTEQMELLLARAVYAMAVRELADEVT
jgi:hypothetical protein